MNIGQRIKQFLGHIKSFNVWDEGHDHAPYPLRILVNLERFVRITIREFLEDRLLLKAMALTFATILTLVPLLAISFSVFKLFGGGEWFQQLVQPFITQNLAPGSGPVVAQKLQEMMGNAGSVTLGGIGVLVLLLAVYGIFAGIESTFNGVWGVGFGNRGIRRIPMYWGMVTIIPILVIGSLALSTYILALPLVHRAVERISFASSILSQLLPWLMMVLGFFLLYRFLPNARVRNRAALSGALVAGVLYEMMKFGFIFYTGKLVKYDFVYGSLAILPLLLVWINLSWLVVLLGVEVCFVTQHFQVLITKSKHVPFSRRQKDSLAFLILVEATAAFRGKRPQVTLLEWSNRFGVPPGVSDEVVERLRKGGIVERTGSDRGNLLLARDPDMISTDELESILGGELNEEWQWPGDPNWNWMKSWMRKKRGDFSQMTKCQTLSELVDQLDYQTRY